MGNGNGELGMGGLGPLFVSNTMNPEAIPRFWEGAWDGPGFAFALSDGIH